MIPQLAAAFLYGNLLEWLVHKYILHGWGRARRGYWAYHWHTHHAAVNRHGLVDPDYRRWFFSSEQRLKETLGIVAAALGHSLLYPWLPWLVLGLWIFAFYYLYVHWRTHVEPDWARRTKPWHVEHHFGRDPDANWCLTFPLMDILLGTRRRYPEVL